jgi:hypothetical protein
MQIIRAGDLQACKLSEAGYMLCDAYGLPETSSEPHDHLPLSLSLSHEISAFAGKMHGR